tara:strand:- start:268 stop:411 length:144 start_codon:yes stop_codon:yes gene_type:complete
MYTKDKNREMQNDLMKSSLRYKYLNKNPNKIASNLNNVPVLIKNASK